MRATPLTVYEPAGDEARLDAAEQRAAQKWRRLIKRVRSTTPTDVLRGVLILAAGYAIWWLTWSTWPALLPFVVGGVVGYAVLPIVNALDRFLPRTLAALLTMAGVAAVLVSILGVLLPALAQQLYRLYEALPGLDDLRSAVAQVRQAVSGLPPPVQDFINTDVSPRVATSLRGSVEHVVNGLVSVTISTVLGLLNTVSFFLGLLVIPTWVLSFVKEQRTAARSIDRLLPDWIQGDFWAVLRIVDRAFGTFIRGQLLLSAAVGLLTYGGLMALGRLTGESVGYPVVLSVLASLLQLVPQLGPILSTVLAAWAGFAVSVPAGVAVIGLYVLVQRLVGAIVGSRVERRVSDLHPAILVLVIVALSQLGLVWVFLAAPVTAIARDLWRYAFGRLGDPPRPAGVLPREPVPLPVTAHVPYRIVHDEMGVRRAPAGRRLRMTSRRMRAAAVAPPGKEQEQMITGNGVADTQGNAASPERPQRAVLTPDSLN